MTNKKARISEGLLRVLNKSLKNLRQPRHYVLDQPLYPSEIHLLALIGHFPNAGVTELAERAGVTKGAVSQLSHKLIKKDLIARQSHPDDAKKVSFKLTNQGYIAFYSHERMHEEQDKMLYDFIRGLKPEQINLLESFLSLVEEGIDKRSET